jgi:hypothetical protein
MLYPFNRQLVKGNIRFELLISYRVYLLSLIHIHCLCNPIAIKRH